MVIDKSIRTSEKSDGAAESVSPIAFRVDRRSGVPTYRQLVDQVEHALRLGYLQRGDQLPRVKDVVGSLSINPNTVLKAYRELEQKGIAAGRPGQGTFIEATVDTVALDKLAALRKSLVRGWLREATEAGISQDEIVALFTIALREVMGGDAPAGPKLRPATGAHVTRTVVA